MRHVIAVVLLLIAITASAQEAVTYRARRFTDSQQHSRRCKLCITFALADSTVTISNRKGQTGYHIIDYTEWQSFEDFDEPWELQDPMLYYQGQRQYFLLKPEGRHAPVDVFLYRSKEGELSMVIDDNGTWILYRPLVIT